MFLLFTILYASLSICNAHEEKLTLECAKKYLKDRKIDEDLLSYVNPYLGSLTDCESAIKSKLAVIYSNLRNKLNGNRLDRPFTECTMRDIEEEDDESYENLVLRETAVEMISNWRFWSYWTKSSRLDDLRADARKIVDKSLLKCKGHREFGDLFSNVQDGTVRWDRSGEEEYCIRSHLVERKLLNTNFYNFNYNPKNVRGVENLKCDPIIESVVNDIYNEIKESKKTSDCFLNEYRKNNYTDHILKSEVLSKLSLSKPDRSREKQDFINSMVDITYGTRDC